MHLCAARSAILPALQGTVVQGPSAEPAASLTTAAAAATYGRQVWGSMLTVRCVRCCGCVCAVFAYPGGASMEIHQALTRSETIDNILCRHEQVRTHSRACGTCTALTRRYQSELGFRPQAWMLVSDRSSRSRTVRTEVAGQLHLSRTMAVV